ncbi:hypothetical protein [Laspinema olomoucense]|uniref:hypothetical protein n=1 Tax=Laspinema olomoucense TaxID=3231600 RepID=UPI0021BA85E1|nr:hypothetical protein [Laspinema sp. D3c]
MEGIQVTLHQRNIWTEVPAIGHLQPSPSIFCIKIKWEGRSLVRHTRWPPPDPPGRSPQRFVSGMLFWRLKR